MVTSFVNAIPLTNGTNELQFENGHTDIVDLVVCADGAFSRIRPILTESITEYTGITMVELNVEIESHPDLAAFNARGKMFGLDDNKAFGLKHFSL